MWQGSAKGDPVEGRRTSEVKTGDVRDVYLGGGTELGQRGGAAPGGPVDWRVAAKLREDLGAEMMGQVLRLAVADLRDAIGHYATALHTGDAERARSAAHMLSSIAAVIGAGALAARAREAEVTARAGHLAAPIAGELERLVDAATAEVEHHLRPGEVV
jgi:HPt (histidine-containing phosphotransfer) domain-containing protein